MNVNPSTARLTNTQLAATVANADTTRARVGFDGSLQRARRDGLIPGAPRTRNTPIATATRRPDAVQAQPLTDARAERATATSTPDRSSIPGDINADGRVDVFDSAILAASYKSGDEAADLDGSGAVDEVDVTILRQNFGKGAEPEASPATDEPSAIKESLAPPTPSADLNNDGRVDVLDFGQLISSYGKSNPSADLFQDGVIDDIDIAIFKQLMNG